MLGVENAGPPRMYECNRRSATSVRDLRPKRERLRGTGALIHRSDCGAIGGRGFAVGDELVCVIARRGELLRSAGRA